MQNLARESEKPKPQGLFLFMTASMGRSLSRQLLLASEAALEFEQVLVIYKGVEGEKKAQSWRLITASQLGLVR